MKEYIGFFTWITIALMFSCNGFQVGFYLCGNETASNISFYLWLAFALIWLVLFIIQVVDFLRNESSNNTNRYRGGRSDLHPAAR